jgi:hypothetical protein
MKNVLIKIACLLAILLWAGSLVCGIVLFIKTKALVVILSFIVLALMSLPAAGKLFNTMTK